MILQQFSTENFPGLTDGEHQLDAGLQIILCPDAAAMKSLFAFWTAMFSGGATAGSGTVQLKKDNAQILDLLRKFDPKQAAFEINNASGDTPVTDTFGSIPRTLFKGESHIAPFDPAKEDTPSILASFSTQLTALVDTGDQEYAAQTALDSIETHLATIGRVGEANTHYADLKEKLQALEAKAEEEAKTRAALHDLAAQRQEVLATMETLHQQQDELEQERQHSEAFSRQQTFREAEQLHTRIETARQHAFALEDMADFPLDRAQEVQKAETRYNTIGLQCDRSRNALLNITEELTEARSDLAAIGGVHTSELTDAQEEQLHETARALENVRERMAQAQDEIEAGQRRLAEAQDAVSALPDFGRMAGEPMEWFNQLASSFSIAKRNKDEECAQRKRLRETVQEKQESLQEDTALFEACQNFPEQAREYELQHRMQGEQRQQHDTDLHQLRIQRDETATSLPQFLWLAALCGLGLIGILIAYFLTGKTAILVAAAFILLTLLFFIASYITHRHYLDRLSSSIAESQAHLDMLATVEDSGPDLIDALLEQSGCETIRELEARYDHYREAVADLSVHEAMLAEYETRAQEAEERLPKLLERLQAAFDQVDERIHGEQDVEAAAGRAIAKYQEYREAKHALAASRNDLDKWRDKHKQYVEEHRQVQDAWATMEVKLRDSLGTTDENPPDTMALLRRYQENLVLRREKQTRIAALEEKQDTLHRQVDEEEAQNRDHRDALETLLQELQVDSPDTFREQAERAREYRDVTEKAAALEAQLDTLLQGLSFETLRDQVNNHTGNTLPSRRNDDALHEDLERITAQIDRCSEEANTLQEQLVTQRAALTPLTEQEEHRAHLNMQLAQLDRHREAAIHALSIIEACAQECHAQTAANLAPRVNEYLAELGQGDCPEVALDASLHISLAETPSNTAWAQPLYLALRLALATLWNETGERHPVLLENPALDGNEESLINALVLLERIAEHQQCLVITTSESLADSAANLGSSVIRI